MLRILLLLTLTALASAEPVRTTPEGTAASLAALAATSITPRDLKTVHYVENAQGQLDEWCARLLARLERGLGPRDPEPLLDGRADLQIAKLRVTYAGYTKSDALASIVRELAAAHEARLAVVRRAIDDGPDPQLLAARQANIDNIIDAIRNWSSQP